MEAVGDNVHCEELKSTLHCDDKEKLRRKLALLKMEYLRTAQRLQRAERSEAVRRHVRSRITQQNHQEQMNPEVTSDSCHHPSSLTLDTQDGAASGAPVCQGPTEDAADSENSRRSQVIRFLLPSDATCPQTPDSSNDAARGHRPSSALRLRSRRSRMRLERRSTEADRRTDNCEDEPEQSERMETARTKGGGERVQTELVNGSEELFSGTDSESPSLLLSHWNTCEQTETGNMEAKETREGQQQREKETESRTEGKKESGLTSLPPSFCSPAIHAEGKGQDGTQNDGRKETKGGEEGENSRGQRNGGLCEDSSNKDTEQNVAEKTEREKSHNSTVKIKEEKSEMVGREHDVNSASLLDSCTLVEGLLFPAEYYVRTTRRMSSSQSQPDMNAVILSQLNKGRHRRSRGRGRGSNRPAQSHECSDQHCQTDLSLLSAASPSVGPEMASQATDTSDLNSQSSREEILAAQINTDACFSPTVSAARPARGRRRGRGRGRGRPQTPRCPLSLDTHQLDLKQASVNPQPISSEVSSPLSLHETDGPKPCLSPAEAAPVPDDSQPPSTHATTAQPSSRGDGTQCSPATEQHVYPVFLKSSDRTKGSTQINKSAANWHSLLLPSSPLAQTSLLPLPSLSPGSLVNNLMNFDIPQDFHLPDDQFASLKLHKLHQVAVESGVEHFSLPYNTRRRLQRSESCNSSDPVMPLSLPLSLTSVISNSPYHSEAKQAAKQCTDLETLSIEHKLTGKLTNQSSTEESFDRENRGEQQSENLHPQCQDHTTSTVSVVQECATHCVNQCNDKDTEILNTHNKGSISASSVNSSIKQPHMNFADRPLSKVNNYVIDQSEESNVISLEKRTESPGEGPTLEDQRSINHPTEDKAVNKTLSYHCPQQETNEEPSDIYTAVKAYEDSPSLGESPVQHLNVKSPANDSKESSEPTTSPLKENRNEDRVHHSVHSQLLLSPPLASAPFITPQLHSSALLSSPTLLPSLGLTPHPLSAALPLTSSPSAPALTTPPPHSPSVQSLSPPVLSPCPSPTPLPPSQPPPSLTGQIQASSEALQRVDSAAISSIHPQVSGEQVGLKTEEAAEKHVMRCTHTLKAPAGGRLVDACTLPGSSGGLCVAAAGKWAVCLWSQTSASDWNLIHTWAFSEPVISLFPVLDADGLMCVTLGQLEIREVRMLSCSSLSQLSLCEGLVQAVVGVSKSRVVTSSHSASQGSTLQVFMLSDTDSTPSSQPLVSPGVCVGALAPVDGLSDALIGTDEGGHLFIWNLKTGQLLRRIVLGDGLSHTACLQGYSYCGVLFVLLQHQLLSSLEEEEREVRGKDSMFLKEEEEERKKSTLFSLVAVNPLSEKSVVASRLYPPKAWSGRLCEADVDSSSVVGMSQSGCVCVWELGRDGSSRMVWAPESEGWQLARWGGGGTLVTGHHNGDVSLHGYSTTKTSICH